MQTRSCAKAVGDRAGYEGLTFGVGRPHLGEQQIVVIARGLMTGPDLLLLSEPSLGLSLTITEEVFARLRRYASSSACEHVRAV